MIFFSSSSFKVNVAPTIPAPMAVRVCERRFASQCHHLNVAPGLESRNQLGRTRLLSAGWLLGVFLVMVRAALSKADLGMKDAELFSWELRMGEHAAAASTVEFDSIEFVTVRVRGRQSVAVASSNS